MEHVEGINPDRIAWCCAQQGSTVAELAEAVGIAPATLERVMAGEDALSVTQLRKIAGYFQRGMLFFLEPGPVDEQRVYTPQFRTIANQRPALSPKVKAFIERVERQREVYVGLREDLGEPVDVPWYPREHRFDARHPKRAAAAARDWLGLPDCRSFDDLRRAVEAKGILVFLSNGYNGAWQISKDDAVRGFSLYYDVCPVIVVKKQQSDGAQAFTLVHELGHLLLHRKSNIDEEADFHSHEGVERAANEFAGHVLVPDGFLAQVDSDVIRKLDITEYDHTLQPKTKAWCVSTETILRRLMDSGLLPREKYAAYRAWRQSLTVPEQSGGGSRYRFREPARVFGEPFVRTVLDAMYGNHISLARASTYLDNLKIKDLHRLEEFVVSV